MSDWDDLFGDEMSVEEDDPAGQTSNEIRLRSSNAATSDSPRTATVPLFRPPQPRNTPAPAPASAPSRSSASRACVIKFADILKLTKENQNVLQKMIENTLPGEEYISTISYLVYIGQESKGSDVFKDQVGEFILRADLQAYSKTVAEDCTTMVQSLEVLTFVRACIPGTAMYLFIKETLKNQRSKLLTKILGVAEDAVVKVPAGKSMVLQ
ncbi:hypothetical protein DFH28DRAFT_928402, partial [Melampsora americana]